MPVCARPGCPHEAVGDEFCSTTCFRIVNNTELPAMPGGGTIRNTRPGTLRCGTCRQWKPDEDFWVDRRKAAARRRGRRQDCKLCSTATRRKYAHTHSEQERARWREHDANPKRRAQKARYNASPKGRATKARYEASPEGRAAGRAASARYKAKVAERKKLLKP